MNKRTGRIGVGCAALLLVFVGCSKTGPSVTPEPALASYSAEPYAEVLAATVRGGGVAYPEIEGELEGKLDVYVDALARFGPRSSPEQFPTAEDETAYYLNAYNAFMLELWLSEGAAEPSPDGGGREVAQAWFSEPRFVLDGQPVSLNDVGKKLKQPRLLDVRRHAALVCGAVSCPPLRDEPYTAARLDEQLDAQMVAWLHGDPSDGLRVADDGVVRLSKVFEWYADEFDDAAFGGEGNQGAGSTGLPAMLRRYLEPDDPRRSAAIAAVIAGDAAFLAYDWGINAVPSN